MIVWTHFFTSPIALTSFGLMESSDIYVWLSGFFIMNGFLFIYTYATIFRGLYGSHNHGCTSNIFDTVCFAHALLESIRFSTISLLLIPRMQYFSYFCFSSENIENWLFYTFYSYQKVLTDRYDFKLLEGIGGKKGVTSITALFNRCLKNGLYGCRDDSKLTSIDSNPPSITENSLNDAIFKAEYNINNTGHQCNRYYIAIILLWAVTSFLLINIIPSMFPLSGNKKKNEHRKRQDDYYNSEDEKVGFKYSQEELRYKSNSNNTYEIDQ